MSKVCWIGELTTKEEDPRAIIVSPSRNWNFNIRNKYKMKFRFNISLPDLPFRLQLGDRSLYQLILYAKNNYL